jgi:hypothetical protein
VRGVDPLDVEGRVGLGVTQRLRLREGLLEARISLRMKFVVPLMMPATRSIRLAARPSRIALMIGIPPATAASNATITPRLEASAKMRLPCTASMALLAVTTCLPLAMAASTRSLATV